MFLLYSVQYIVYLGGSCYIVHSRLCIVEVRVTQCIVCFVYWGGSSYNAYCILCNESLLLHSVQYVLCAREFPAT
jgi:hypothetical protein